MAIKAVNLFFLAAGGILLSDALPAADSQRGIVTWYEACPGYDNIGTILNVSQTDCVLGNCYLEKLVPQRNQIYFRAGGSHAELLYNLYIVSGFSNYYLEGGSARQNTEEGVVYDLTIDFSIPSRVKNGDNSMQINLWQPGSEDIYEFCIQFNIDGVLDGSEISTPPPGTSPVPSSTTLSSTTVITTEPPTSTITTTEDPTTTEEPSTTLTPSTTLEPSTTQEPSTTWEPSTTAISSTTQDPTTLTPSTITTPDVTYSTIDTTQAPFICTTQGIFPDPFSCVIYHTCTQFADGSFWDQVLQCAPGTTYCLERYNCGFPANCPCWLP